MLPESKAPWALEKTWITAQGMRVTGLRSSHRYKDPMALSTPCIRGGGDGSAGTDAGFTPKPGVFLSCCPDSAAPCRMAWSPFALQ
jgi:hypothetical protein